MREVIVSLRNQILFKRLWVLLKIQNFFSSKSCFYLWRTGLFIFENNVFFIFDRSRDISPLDDDISGQSRDSRLTRWAEDSPGIRRSKPWLNGK